MVVNCDEPAAERGGLEGRLRRGGVYIGERRGERESQQRVLWIKSGSVSGQRACCGRVCPREREKRHPWLAPTRSKHPSRHLETSTVGERPFYRSGCALHPVCSSSSSTTTTTRTTNSARDRERLGGYSLVGCLIMRTSRLRMLRPPFPFHRLAARFSPRLSLLRRNLAMAISDWRTVPQHDSVPPYSIFSKSIEKSHFDKRHYRVIRLDNGLTAMLVHDPRTESAAASLDVAVGHLSDPVSDTSSVATFAPFHSLNTYSQS